MGELDVYKLNFFDFLEAEDGQSESSSAEVTGASALIFEIVRRSVCRFGYYIFWCDAISKRRRSFAKVICQVVFLKMGTSAIQGVSNWFQLYCYTF